MKNRSTVTVSTLIVLDKRVKKGHRLEKPEHCDREYTFSTLQVGQGGALA